MEVMIVVVIMAIVGLGIASLMSNANRQQQSITSASDFNTLVNTIQGILNNSGACIRAFGGTGSTPLVAPSNASQPVTMTMGTTVLKGVSDCSANLPSCQKYGNNLAITTLAITSVTTLSAGAGNQYVATLTLTTNRAQGQQTAVGGSFLSKTFTMIVTVDAGNISNCSGQNTDFWVGGTNSTATSASIAYTGGPVGIGTASPGSGTTTLNSAILLDVAGTAQAQAFLYTSDARLKENIREIPNALERALKLRGVVFDWKNKTASSQGLGQMGFIAQEVESIFPEVVSTHPGTGMKAVAYGNLVAPLVEALKQQQQIILLQQQEIDDIKKVLQKNNVR
jgi:hypothetical protein